MSKFVKYGQYLILLCCLIAFFYLLKDFNSAKLKDIISQINYGWIIIAMAFAAVNILFKTYRLKIISEQFNYKIGFEIIYKTQIISLIFALLTPGRVGEVSKLYLLSDNNKEKYPQVTSIMLFEILFDFICIALISLLFVIFAMKNLAISIAIIILILMVLSLAFFIRKGSSFVKRMPAQVQSFFKFTNSNKVKLTHKWYLTTFLTLSAWIIDGFFQYFILRAVNLNSDIFILIPLSTISSILSVLSILPLGFGVTDLSSLYLYKKFQGLNTESILYLVNSSRLFIVLTLFILGIPFIQLLYKRSWFTNAVKESET